jgi:hypothetical protein
MISEAFAEIAYAERRHGPLRVRAYVVDELVLTVTERDLAPAPRHGSGEQETSCGGL